MDTGRRPAPQSEPDEGDEPTERGGDTRHDPRIERAVPRPAPEKR